MNAKEIIRFSRDTAKAWICSAVHPMLRPFVLPIAHKIIDRLSHKVLDWWVAQEKERLESKLMNALERGDNETIGNTLVELNNSFLSE